MARISEETLQAYHDGELGWLARWRVERRLAASPEARRALDRLGLVGELVRESQTAPAGPDLWADIARQLPAAAPVEARAPGGRWAEALGGLLRPAGVALATAAAAVAAFLLLSGGEPSGMTHVVQYLDPGENSVMLLQGEDDATIIWVMEPVATDTSSSRENRALI